MHKYMGRINYAYRLPVTQLVRNVASNLCSFYIRFLKIYHQNLV
jgi:hypothetical protein